MKQHKYNFLMILFVAVLFTLSGRFTSAQQQDQPLTGDPINQLEIEQKPDLENIKLLSKSKIDKLEKKFGHFEAVPKDSVVPIPITEPEVGIAAIISHGRFTSFQVNVDSFGNNIIADAANEPSITIDPTNPNRIAIGWRQFATLISPTAFRQAGVSFTADGGATWTFPGVLSPLFFASDPVLDTDLAGNFYYYSLQPGRGPGLWACYMLKSFDGGATWPQEVYGLGGDKAWIAVDRTDSPGQGNIYMHWSNNSAAVCCFPNNFTRSTDGGLTFMTPVQIPPSIFAGTNDVGPNGEVYIVGFEIGAFSPRKNFFVRSSDAYDNNVTPSFDLVTQVDLDGERSIFDVVNPAGISGQIQVVSDHSNGVTRGNIYVLCSVDRISNADPLDVMFVRSEDGGVNFSAPVRVNDDSVGNGAYQWFGTISVAPNGRIDVAWLDTRNDATPNTPTFSELFYSFSLDGGLTWSVSETVGPPFNHFLGYPNQNKMGDYFDIVSDNGGAHLAYAATYNGEQDVYYVRLTPDCNGNGVPDEDDIAGITSDDCNGNQIPDECEPQLDCNNNTVQDICDVAGVTSEDCNNNFVPDECESQDDCNNNTIQDICDVAGGTSTDCNDNLVLDECEPDGDCNSNGTLDECDIAVGGESGDCNENSVPDECDIALGTSLDDNSDGIPDECVGACCVCNDCIQMTVAECAGLNGFFNGINVFCDDVGVDCGEGGNDDCANAVVLPSMTDMVVPYDNRCATNDGPANVPCEAGSTAMGADLWYEYVAPCCGLLTVSMCDGTAYDGMMAIYGGGDTCTCPTNNSSLLGCGDDTCNVPAGPAVVTIPVTKDACYSLRIGGWAGASAQSEFTISMTCIPGGSVTGILPVGHWDEDAGSYVDVGAYSDVWADGNIVYQGQILSNRVHFFDISDPDQPQRFREWISPFPNNNASSEDVKVANGLLFISLFGDGNDGVEIVDVRDPFNPAHLSYITVPGFEDVKNTWYDNGYLYLANGTTNVLAVVDLTTYDPDAPPASITTALRSINVGTSLLDDMMVQDNRLYVAAFHDGVFIYDVTDIATMDPQLLGSSAAWPSTHSVWPSADGQWVVAAQRRIGGALQLYEIVPNGSNVDIIVRQTIAPPATSTSFHNVVVDGNRVYTTVHETGVNIYEIDAGSATLLPAGNYPTYYQNSFGGFAGAFGVYPFLDNGLVAISDINTGLHIIKLSGTELSITYPDGLPSVIDPSSGATITVQLGSACEDPASASLWYRMNENDSFTEVPLISLGGEFYEASLPSSDCGSQIQYYIQAATISGRSVFDPLIAPVEQYMAVYALSTALSFSDSFENDLGWVVSNDVCPSVATQTGIWNRVDPNSTLFAPENDSVRDVGNTCYVTADFPAGTNVFAGDMDGGPFYLTSPEMQTFGEDSVIGYDRWFYAQHRFLGFNGALLVEVSTNGGASWSTVEAAISHGPRWVHREFILSDFATPSGTVMLKFTGADCPNAEVPEAGVDNITVTNISCTACPLLAPAAPEPVVINKSRYLSFEPGNAGSLAAIRVVLTDLDGFGDYNGQVRWVGEPQEYPEGDNPEPTFMGAPLQCSPYYQDWSTVGLLHVHGEEVVPNSIYDIQMLSENCLVTLEENFSTPLTVFTSRFCDVKEPFNSSQPSIDDVLAVVGKWLGEIEPVKARSQLQPALFDPSKSVNIDDVLITVKSWLGSEYPFDINTMCP